MGIKILASIIRVIQTLKGDVTSCFDFKMLAKYVIGVALVLALSTMGVLSKKQVNGYYENWAQAVTPGPGSSNQPSYYVNDIAHCDHILYAFLCLDQHPNPDWPAQKYWSGNAIYETMTAADVITVMTKTDPLWMNPYEWQRAKVAAMIEAVHDQGGKFIWSIGGWSDLTKTIHESQIPTFVSKCIQLLQLEGGTLADGIDFDWEHLSEDSSIKTEQRQTLAKTIHALRQAMDQNGMRNMSIGYTTRFNAFWDDAHHNVPSGYSHFASDGEGLSIEETLNSMGSSLNELVDWVHIMQYDVPPNDLNATYHFTLQTYITTFDAFAKHINKDKIVMGFEPGPQAAGGVWEGETVDDQVIDYVNRANLGGVMFWAMNERGNSPSTGINGKNSQRMAKYAASQFN